MYTCHFSLKDVPADELINLLSCQFICTLSYMHGKRLRSLERTVELPLPFFFKLHAMKNKAVLVHMHQRVGYVQFITMIDDCCNSIQQILIYAPLRSQRYWNF